MCLKNKNYSLKGDFYSKQFSYLHIQLLRCQPSSGIKCKNSTEIANFFNPLRLNFAFVNSYFDLSTFD